jgi:hypothetical protein
MLRLPPAVVANTNAERLACATTALQKSSSFPLDWEKTGGEERVYPVEGRKRRYPFFHDRVHDLLDCAIVSFNPLKRAFATVYGSCRLPCFDYQTMQIAMFNGA